MHRFADQRELRNEIFRRVRPVRLVFGIKLGAESFFGFIKHDGQMRRLVGLHLGHQLPQHVAEAEHGVDLQAVGLAGERRRRVIGAEDVTGAVHQKQMVALFERPRRRVRDGGGALSFVYDAAREIAGALGSFTVVITKSTVPVGTGDEVERIIREAKPKAEFAVVSNPEFLREGAAIQDFKHPDRVVVGSDDARARDVMTELYRPLYLNRSPILFTDRRTAELIKYAANAFLATKITFINEIADLAEKVGADVQEIARGIGLDNRIGSKFLHAGPGYGGSCFPKDTLALLKTGQDNGAPLRIVEAVVSVNDARKRAMARL